VSQTRVGRLIRRTLHNDLPPITIARMDNSPPPHADQTSPAAARLLLVLVDLYAGAALLYLLLRLLTGDRFWPVRLADTFGHWLLLPAVPLFAVTLAARRWRHAAALAAPALAFAALFGGLF